LFPLESLLKIKVKRIMKERMSARVNRVGLIKVGIVSLNEIPVKIGSYRKENL
jgi:hypothetical protein